MNFDGENMREKKEPDNVEKFVRMLISRNELSLSRNIIGALGDNYNHLLFELEVQSGNYKKALEIFNNLPKEKQQIYVHIVDVIEKDADKVSEAFGNLIKNLQSENFAIFVAEAQKLRKDYPQIVEVVALELIAAIRRGDKRKVKTLSEILEQLDKSHPALSYTKGRNKEVVNILGPAILVAVFVVVLVNLMISIFSLGTSDTMRFSNLSKQIADIGKNIAEISNQNKQSDNQLSILSQNIKNLEEGIEKINNILLNYESLKSQQNYDDKIIQQINSSIEEVRKSLKNLGTNLRDLDKKFSSLNPNSYSTVRTLIKDVDNTQEILNRYKQSIDEQIRNVLSDFAVVKEKMNTLSKKIDSIQISQPDGKYSSSYQIDTNQISKLLEEIYSQIKELSKVSSMQRSTSLDAFTVQNVDMLRKLQETMESIKYYLLIFSKADITKLDKLDELNSLKNSLDVIRESLEIIKSKIFDYTQSTSTTNAVEMPTKIVEGLNKQIADIKSKIESLEQKIEESTKFIRIQSEKDVQDTNSTKIANNESLMAETNQEIINIKVKLNILEQKIEELKVLVNDFKTQGKQNNQSNNNELVSLKATISSLEKTVEDLKTSLTTVNSQITELKTNILEKSSKVETSVQKGTETTDVQQIVKETKDLYELYRIGLSYYSSKLYQEAIYILKYLENQLEGVDVYFKEDIYYYQVMSYLKLGDKQNAQKKFQEYKKLFPAGNYIKELSVLF
ncbi:MAG: hypothetical protein N2Z58_03660 [Fervidobacterium sp.]|nr:hypothetical protein [Fervidobacterium sp.]